MTMALHLLSQLLILVDELADGRILVAEPPALVDNDGHKYQHHHDGGGGEGYGEYEVCFHTL